MKYKTHIATGALAFSLLVSGSNVYASTPQDLGIKNVQQAHPNKKNSKVKIKGRGDIIGNIETISPSGFTLETKNKRTGILLSLDVRTDSGTIYTKNGLQAQAYDLSVGQKVIVVGDLDKTTNTLTAKKIKIA